MFGKQPSLPERQETMKNLNECNGFNWVTKPQDTGYAKCSVGGESFWIRDCKFSGNGTFVGVVDNVLICTDVHGLSLGDVTEFLPNWEPPR